MGRADDPWSTLDDEGESSSRGKRIAISLGIILGALVLGAGAGYGYWKLSAPKPSASQNTPATSGTPQAAPGVTPHAWATNDRPTVWVIWNGPGGVA